MANKCIILLTGGAIMINEKEDNNKELVKISGEIDVFNISQLKDRINSIELDKKDVIIDFSDLEFLDSIGLGVLIELSKRAKSKDLSVELHNPPNHIVKLLSTTEVDKLFKIKRNQEPEVIEKNVEDYCNDELNMVLPSKPAYVGVARLALSAVASRYGFDIESIEDIKIAITEVLTNAISHNGPKVDNVSIKTKFYCNKRVLRIDVSDEGIGFDEKSLEESTLKNLEPGGLGLFIVKSLMDKVEIISSPGNGTYIKMYKNGAL